jgi:DNA topoisomerase-1
MRGWTLRALPLALALLGLGRAAPALAVRDPAAARAAKAARIRGGVEKFARVDHFSTVRPLLRAHASQLLDAQGELTLATAQAAIFRVMELTHMRVGSERYTDATKKQATDAIPSFGASSLRKEQVTLDGDRITFTFIGKSRKPWQVTTEDPQLAAVMRRFMELPGARLFQIHDGNGELVPVTETAVRAFMKGYGKPKDLRTDDARTEFRNAVAQIPADAGRAQLDRGIRSAVDNIASMLNHGETVSRRQYIGEQLIDETYRARGLLPPGDRGTADAPSPP